MPTAVLDLMHPPSPRTGAVVGMDITRLAEQAAIYGPAIEVICTLLQDMALLVEASSHDMNDQLYRLAEQAKTQSDELQQLLAQSHALQVGDIELSTQDFIRLFNQTVLEMVRKVIFVSEQSIRLTYQLDASMEKLDEVESFIEHITRINESRVTSNAPLS